jgi:hypothetical protein
MIRKMEVIEAGMPMLKTAAARLCVHTHRNPPAARNYSTL